jgi:hypothetical protein
VTDPDELLDPDSHASEGSIHNSQQSQPEAPSPPDPNADLPDAVANYEDVDPALRTLFWKLVVFYKIGLLATSLGGLLFAFRGSTLGLRAFALGVVVLAYAVYRTYRSRRRLDDEEFDHDDATPSGSSSNTKETNSPSTDDAELEGQP